MFWLMFTLWNGMGYTDEEVNKTTIDFCRSDAITKWWSQGGVDKFVVFWSF